MKVFLLLAAIFIFKGPLFAQIDSAGNISLQICCTKTTSIVFPQLIKSIDRGSQDVLVQKVNGVGNVLQMKAAKENFAETNMTVITADGRLYSFIIRFAGAPARLNLRLDTASTVFEKIAARKRTIHGVKATSYDMRLRLKGLYIQSEILYYQLEVENFSNISYNIHLLRFYTRDKKQSKRTASQELDQIPLAVFGNTEAVPAQSKQIIIVALPQFTIPDKKHFYIDMLEKNGGRNLRLKITNRKIIKAIIIWQKKMKQCCLDM